MKAGKAPHGEQGYTLLEVLVATTILALAVVSLLGAVNTALGNASRLTEYDRAHLLARRVMEELRANPRLAPGWRGEGMLPPEATGGRPGGWQARVEIFEAPPQAAPGSLVLSRIALELWVGAEERRRVVQLESYRIVALPAESMGAEAAP